MCRCGGGRLSCLSEAVSRARSVMCLGVSRVSCRVITLFTETFRVRMALTLRRLRSVLRLWVTLISEHGIRGWKLSRWCVVIVVRCGCLIELSCASLFVLWRLMVRAWNLAVRSVLC